MTRQRMPKPRRIHQIIQMQNAEQIKYNSIPNIVYSDDELGVESQQCKICLEGQTANSLLITPCKCIGSVKYVHEQCIRQWIQRSLLKKIDPIKCQICKQQIMYQLFLERECNKWGTIKYKIVLNYKIFLFLFFLLLINFGVTVYLIVVFIHLIQTSGGSPKFIEIGILGFSIALLMVISAVLISIIVKEFGYSEVKRIGQVYNYQNRLERKSSFERSKAQIFPVQNMTQIEQLQ